MRKLLTIGLLAALVSFGLTARAWVTWTPAWGGTVTTPGTATTINADAGALGSAPFLTPNTPLGVDCTISTPGASMNGGTVYTPAFFQQVSNDGTNWQTIDGGAVPGTGVGVPPIAVNDAGPYQYNFEIVPVPWQYSRIIVGGTIVGTSVGLLSCTAAHP